MTKVRDVVGFLQQVYPPHCEEQWDNSGLQIGSLDEVLTSAVIALDVDLPVVDEAISKGANLLISHHPLFFRPLKRVDYSAYMGELVRKIILNGINVYSLHTNFDSASGGLNDILLEMMGLSSSVPVVQHPDGECGGIGRVVVLPEPRRVKNIAVDVRINWEVSVLSYVGCLDRCVSKLAVCGGSGADLIERCISLGVELYITADVKYHEAMLARANGMNLLILNHFEMERASLGGLKELLTSEFAGVNFYLSAVYTNPIRLYKEVD